jgi:HSP20 family protein
MTLIKWKNNPALAGVNQSDGFSLFPATSGDFFDDFLNERFWGSEMRSVPAVNIAEHAENFSIELAAPGFSKADFKVAVENGVLTISAEKKEEKKDENKRFTRKEFAYSSFKRTFSLPDNVNGDGIAAAYTDGLLSLTLPKKDEAKQKPVKEIAVS